MKVYTINENEVKDDVLERIDGYESFVGVEKEEGSRIFDSFVLSKIVSDEEDDTNETTKIRIEELLQKINRDDCTHFLIKK